MNSILEEFARGNISPDARFFERNSRLGHAMKELTDIETALMDKLNGDEKALLLKFASAQAEVSLLSGIDRFIYGYRLGVLMTMEVFNGRDDLMVGGEDC